MQLKCKRRKIRNVEGIFYSAWGAFYISLLGNERLSMQNPAFPVRETLGFALRDIESNEGVANKLRGVFNLSLYSFAVS